MLTARAMRQGGRLAVCLSGALLGAASPAWANPLREDPTVVERALDRVTATYRATLVQVESHRPQSTIPRTGASLLPSPANQPYRVLRSTGVVIDGAGHILTCADNAQPTDSVVVRLPGGEALPATYVSQEAATGLTLLSAPLVRQGRTPLVPGACNAVREGDLVLVVSMEDRVPRPEIGTLTKIREGSFQGSAAQLEIDLARPVGICGGLVLDGNGSLVGLVVDCGGSLEGATLVEMPVSMPTRVLARAAVFETAVRLQQRGQNAAGFLGVQADRVGLAAKGDLPTAGAPIAVVHVLPGSPAEIAGLVKGDQIVALAGAPVNEVEEVSQRIGSTPPGTWVAMTVLRNGSPMEIRARVGDRSMLEWMEWSFLRIGAARASVRTEMDRLEGTLQRLDAATAAYQ